jgi:hypothetical protein
MSSSPIGTPYKISFEERKSRTHMSHLIPLFQMREKNEG